MKRNKSKKAGFWDTIVLIFVFLIVILLVVFLGPRLISYLSGSG